MLDYINSSIGENRVSREHRERILLVRKQSLETPLSSSTKAGIPFKILREILQTLHWNLIQDQTSSAFHCLLRLVHFGARVLKNCYDGHNLTCYWVEKNGTVNSIARII